MRKWLPYHGNHTQVLILLIHSFPSKTRTSTCFSVCPAHMCCWGEWKGFSIITEFMAGRKDPVYRELLALERIRSTVESSLFLSRSHVSSSSFLCLFLFLPTIPRCFYASLRPSENAYATFYDRRA